MPLFIFSQPRFAKFWKVTAGIRVRNISVTRRLTQESAREAVILYEKLNNQNAAARYRAILSP